MSTNRETALTGFTSHKAERFSIESRPVSEYFGCNVFDDAKMKRYLSPEAYEEVMTSIREGVSIDRKFADSIASGMQAWAMEMGATHYSHWFHPMTDSTAEKHEAFIDKDKEGIVSEHFNGNALVQQEPDASSFPSGGLRNTFEARGYTAWDPSSPAFIIDGTLCIPTIFVSYTGESLDMKIPHLKSLQAIDHAATDVVNLFDKSVKRVNVTLGIEQEYFVVDEALNNSRPDLQICSRTLIGHTAAKDQQLEDHYFGAIPSRVMCFMKDFETEAYKLGILLKTRHNEVAPNQFECAPLFCEANLAADQNLILMIVMRKVAAKHHLTVLFHEKPFMGVNGSGKHCNWSLITDKGANLLSPGKTPRLNLQFLSIFACVIRGVYEHHHLLMASAYHLNNSYRLGGNEAPPAVMSVFTGATLNEVINSIEKMDGGAASENAQRRLNVVNKIPDILPDNTDRNRTSPFAFTGNRFEFRAVGSSVNVSSSMYVLNAAAAQSMIRFRRLVDEKVASGAKQEDAVLSVIRQFLKESEPIRFEGNGYSREWAEEAARRGLKGVSDVPESNKAFISEKSVELFTSLNILTKREVEARYEIMDEVYTKKLQIESRVLGDMIINHVIPTAVKFQNTLVENVLGIQKVFGEKKGNAMCSRNVEMIEKISVYINDLKDFTHDMIEARRKANAIEDYKGRAEAYSKTVAPFFDKIRDKSDKLEMLVDDELWPLPKYRELMFCK